MLTTEAEARQKGCPLVVKPNGTSEAQTHTKCIASDCMAWRWYFMFLKELPPNIVISPERYGYCGEFGKPEEGLHQSASTTSITGRFPLVT